MGRRVDIIIGYSFQTLLSATALSSHTFLKLGLFEVFPPQWITLRLSQLPEYLCDSPFMLFEKETLDRNHFFSACWNAIIHLTPFLRFPLNLFLVTDGLMVYWLFQLLRAVCIGHCWGFALVRRMLSSEFESASYLILVWIMPWWITNVPSYIFGITCCIMGQLHY